MKHGYQRILAELAGVNESRISQILKGGSPPSYELAKRLSEIIEGTDPIIWLELDMKAIERALERWNPIPEKAA